HEACCLPLPLAPLLPPGEASLCPSQGLLCPTVAARIVHRLPVCRYQKRLEALALARLFARRRQWWIVSSAHEKEMYQPSAPRERVTVVGMPANGRLQRTASWSLLESTKKPLSRVAPLPHGLQAKAV